MMARKRIILGRATVTLAFASICGFAYAASQTDKDLAASQAQVLELRKQVASSQQRDADNRAAIARLQAQMAARSKEAAASTQSEATGRDVAAATAVTASKAVASVQDSQESIQMQLAELQAARPANSVAVWLAAISAIGALITGLCGIFMGLINHQRIGTVQSQTDGMGDKIAALSEAKGRAEGIAAGKNSLLRPGE